MPYDSGGLYSLVPSYRAIPGQTIRTEQHNPVLEDLASALSSVLVRDGRAGMVGPLPMGGFPINNLGASQNPTSAATVGQIQGASPIGIVSDFAGSTPPAGWLLCYGQAISRTTYADLFTVIGTTYGAGDGSTTFNIPDCRGRVSAGRDNMGGTDAGRLSTFFGAVARTLGGVLGAASHLLTAAQSGLKSHAHTGVPTSATVPIDGYGTFGGSLGSVGAGRLIVGSGVSETGETLESLRASGNVINIGLQGNASTGAATPADATDAHPNAQPTIIFNKIIRATY